MATVATATVAASNEKGSPQQTSPTKTPFSTAITNATVNENPVPSITLSITQDDVKRVLEASEALSKKLCEMRQRETATNMTSSPVLRVDNCTNRRLNETLPVINGAITIKEKHDVDGNNSPGEPPLRTVSTSEDEGTKDCPLVSSSRTKRNNRPLDELIYDAARQCDNNMLQSFLEKMKNSGSSSREIRAGVMVFSDMDLNSKIKRIFDVLGNNGRDNGSSCVDQTKISGDEQNGEEKSLTRDGALSLFRAVIVAISSCIHKNAKVQIDMGNKQNEGQPEAKRRKPNTPEANWNKNIVVRDNDGILRTDSVPSLKSPTVSFDNSTIATIKEEDDLETPSVRKEFEEIAIYATDRLVKYTQKKLGNIDKVSIVSDDIAVTFGIFQSWRKAEGAKIAPWLDLLNLSRWKTPQRSTERDTVPPQMHNHSQQSTRQKQGTQHALSQTKIESEEINNSTLPTIKTPSTQGESLALANKNEKSRDHLVLKSETEDVPSISHTLTHISSQTPLYTSNKASRTVLSFDFSGSLSEEEGASTFCITITEENLITFRRLVERTSLINRSSHEITTILLQASKDRDHEGVMKKIIPIERFHTCLHQLLGSGSTRRLSKIDRDIFSSCFVDFFGCFNSGTPPLESGEAFTYELAVGFCFLCAGNKSSKLATGFELLERQIGMGLTSNQLVRFLRSYLTMLAGISFLTSSPDGVMKPKLNATTRKMMYAAVENGARWTLTHFLKDVGLSEDNNSQTRHTFESFASWYSSGGFNTAPWLELLDLKKLLSLVIGDDVNPKSSTLTHDAIPIFSGPPKTASPEFISPQPSRPHLSTNHHSNRHLHNVARHAHNSSGPLLTPFGHSRPPSSVQTILFTFPLANQCSLVVLKEDATYVRGVVDQLGLLLFSPEEVWSTLYNIALKRPALNRPKKQLKSAALSKSMLLDKLTFVECMHETIRNKVKTSKKRSANGLSKSLSDTRDVLSNFFRSFDLVQTEQVSLNELMGGLTLLCGGKKSTKLSFAFSLFDRRQNGKKKGKKSLPNANSLDGEELFLFLRSFLIVTFSCCRQSWDLSDDAVNRYIADTANMVTDDVMRYQWRKRKKERVDFDEFGQWYNEGGYQTAPWLELLDLTKWVLVENFDSLEKHFPPDSPGDALGLGISDPDCPPAPPDAEVDTSFFDDDAHDIMPMDSIDEMDLLLMQQPSQDKEDAALSKLVRSFPYSPKPSPKAKTPPRNSNSLKFHIVTDDSHNGFCFSVSQKRLRHLRYVLLESGLPKIDGEKASKEILAKAYRDGKSSSRNSHYVLTKDGFDSAMRRVIVGRNMSVDTQRTLSNLLNDIFIAFEYDGTGKANAFDIACGFTLLCQGKKSDKLEFAFDILDREKGGFLLRSDVTRYLRSFLLVLVKITSSSSLDSDFVDDVMTSMSGEKCDNSFTTVSRAVDVGCQWAAQKAMKGSHSIRDTISFDDFADWYTRVGHSNIPWVELLDLTKWVSVENFDSLEKH